MGSIETPASRRRFGRILRFTREALGLSIEQVAAGTQWAGELLCEEEAGKGPVQNMRATMACYLRWHGPDGMEAPDRAAAFAEAISMACEEE